MAISAGDVVVQFGGETGKFDQAVNHVENRMKSTGDKMTKWGKNLSMRVTAPLVALGIGAFKMTGDFDQAMRKVNVMLGASAEDFEEYKDKVLDISSATGKSATDVADAFYQIVSAGYRGADAIDILRVAMEGAVGGAADATATTAALTKAMNIFQLEGVEGAARAMDTFFGIVDTGLLTFEEMAHAFPMAATMAAGLGISIEETGAALGTLTKVSGSTDEAATALNATFTALVKPSEAMLALYQQWGVSTGPEAIKKFGGLAGVLKAVEEATAGESDALAELFPNIRAIRAVLPLVTTASEDFAGALDTVKNSTGRTGEAFQEMAQGPGFQWQQMMVNIKNAMIELGDVLAGTIGPIITRLTGWIKSAVEWFSKLPDPVKRLAVGLGLVAVAIGPVMLLTGMLIKAYITLKGLTLALVGLTHSHTVALVAHKVAMIAHKMVSLVAIGVMKLITLAQWAWNAAMNANPIGAIITLIGLLVAAGIYLWKNWDKVVAFFKSAWRKVKLIFLSGVEKVLGALARFTAWIPFVGDKVAALHDKIASMIDAEKIGSDAERAAASLAELAKKVGEASDDMVADVEQATQAAIQSAQTVADEEKRILETRAQYYRDLTAERLGLIDEQMMAELAAMDPTGEVARLAAKYNESLGEMKEEGAERDREIEEDRVEALKEELRLGEDLTEAREREIEDQIADIEDRWKREELGQELHHAIMELDSDGYFEGQKSLIDSQLETQITAYNTELEAFKALNKDKLDDAREFVEEYNRIMAGLGAEKAHEFEVPKVPGQPTRGGAPPRGYASWGVYDQIKNMWQESGKSWEAFAKGRGMGELPIPTLGKGALVTGPTLAMLGERFKPELVLPLEKLGSILRGVGDTFNYYVSFPGLVVREEADIPKLSRAVGRELRIIQDRTERRVGLRGG